MRGSIFVLVIAATALASGCARSEARVVAEAPDALDPVDAASLAVRGTVEAGEVFELAWPNDDAARACIRIPADAVEAGTEVTIDLEASGGDASAYPRRFREASQRGRSVFPPIVRISADPDFTIENPDAYFTVGICAVVPQGTPFGEAQVAHNDPGDPDGLELLELADPCALVCGKSPLRYGQQSRAGILDWLLAGTPLRPEPLHAALAEEGLGGKGGSLSPFGVVTGR